MRKFIGINAPFDESDTPCFVNFGITEGISILDYDAVIIYADNLCSEFTSEYYRDTYRGLLSLNENQTKAIITCYETLKEQIIESLKNGKYIYVLIGHNENCYIDTGRRSTSGTGRNATTTRIVEEFDSYGFLPIGVKTTETLGTSVTPCGNTEFSEFMKKIASLSCYQASIDQPSENQLAKAGDSEKTVSSYCDFEQGRIVFLPPPCLAHEFETEQDYELCSRRYLEELIALDEMIHCSTAEFELPSWATQITMPGELQLRKNLAANQETLANLKEEIEKQKEGITDLERYKLLLTSSGTQLEEIVQLVLGELGFILEETRPGRSDIIASYAGKPIVAEIKGLAKSAAEKNCAQLEKWAAEYFEEKGQPAKPLLIVNAFKGLPLDKRSQPVFPNQMLAYAMHRSHCLISTAQLLCLYVDTNDNPVKRNEAVEKMLSTVGVYNEYENPLAVLSYYPDKA